MQEKLKLFIKENKESKKHNFHFINPLKKLKNIVFSEDDIDDCCYENISTFINNEKNENQFQKLLFQYIDERNLTDSDVYNKVHIDRRLFSKIRNNKKYHPSKETILLLGFSLELAENEIIALLNSASYSLPKNNNYDLIIRFCFREKIYKIKDVNELLASYNCKLFNY